MGTTKRNELEFVLLPMPRSRLAASVGPPLPDGIAPLISQAKVRKIRALGTENTSKLRASSEEMEITKREQRNNEINREMQGNTNETKMDERTDNAQNAAAYFTEIEITTTVRAIFESSVGPAAKTTAFVAGAMPRSKNARIILLPIVCRQLSLRLFSL